MLSDQQLLLWFPVLLNGTGESKTSHCSPCLQMSEIEEKLRFRATDMEFKQILVQERFATNYKRMSVTDENREEKTSVCK